MFMRPTRKLRKSLDPAPHPLASARGLTLVLPRPCPAFTSWEATSLFLFSVSAFLVKISELVPSVTE